MDSPERIVYTPPQFCRLCKDYRVRIRALRAGPFPPVHYAAAFSKIDGEPIALLWYDQAREEWPAFAPDEAEEEVRELLGLG